MLTLTCPNCGTSVESANARFISESPTLLGDPILGPDAPLRFRPVKFTAGGFPVDPAGFEATRPACPKCRAEWPVGFWSTAPHGADAADA
jgi:ribosomal protein S27AE